MRSRKIKDILLNSLTYLFSSFGVLILILIFIFIFSNGAKSLSFDLLNSDYYSKSYTLKYEQKNNQTFIYNCNEDEYFSTHWGVAFKDVTNLEGEEVVIICYVDDHSPLTNMINMNNNQYISIEVNQQITKAILVGNDDTVVTVLAKDNAASVAKKFDKAISITNLSLKTDGGGIRGSLVATLILILITLGIALPVGVCAAIYLSVYAKKNRLTNILESMIDMTGGIPSIIFGLVGVIIFIPTLNGLINSDGVSLMAGALTMSIMLLPVIIKTTKEAIDVIPKSLSQASLALGATQTQTTFKIILPNAIPGILTSTLLCIGRIIGESAALIFVVGSQVSDNVAVNKGGTTLATHIWNLLSGENPNYELACAISIVILTIVLLLNIIVKLVGKKLNKFSEV